LSRAKPDIAGEVDRRQMEAVPEVAALRRQVRTTLRRSFRARTRPRNGVGASYAGKASPLPFKKALDADNDFGEKSDCEFDIPRLLPDTNRPAIRGGFRVSGSGVSPKRLTVHSGTDSVNRS
jgi:hypothetical protein